MARTSPFRPERLALARQMLSEDGQVSGYRITKALQAKYGHGLGQEDLDQIRAEVLGTSLPREVTFPASTSTIEEVQVPLEMQEHQEMPEPPGQMMAPAVPALPAIVPNGTTASFQNIQAWMRQNQAEQVILNKDGQCSVLAWHHFNVGGPTNG